MFAPPVNDNVTGEQMRQYRQSVFESLQDYLKSELCTWTQGSFFVCCLGFILVALYVSFSLCVHLIQSVSLFPWQKWLNCTVNREL